MNPCPSSYLGTFAESPFELRIITHFKDENTESQSGLLEMIWVWDFLSQACHELNKSLLYRRDSYVGSGGAQEREEQVRKE